MKCPYCKEFKGNSKVRGYPVSEQLRRHIMVDHIQREPTLLEELAQSIANRTGKTIAIEPAGIRARPAS